MTWALFLPGPIFADSVEPTIEDYVVRFYCTSGVVPKLSDITRLEDSEIKGDLLGEAKNILKVPVEVSLNPVEEGSEPRSTSMEPRNES